MKDKVSTLFEGSFLKNLAVISGSRMVGLLTGLLLTPIIARVYSPEEYGAFSFFLAVAKNLALLSALKYPTAFFAAKDREELRSLIRGSFLLVVGFTLLCSIGLALWWSFFLGQDSTYFTPLLFLLLVIRVFMSGNMQIVSNKHIIEKEFSKSAQIGMSSNVLNKLYNIFHGVYVSVSHYGLILGDLLSTVLNLFFRWIFIHRWRIPLILSFKHIKQDLKVLKAYKDYPLQMLPSAWIGRIGAQIPIFVIGYFFHADDLGSYTMTIGVLNIPLQLLSGSVSPVFSQRVRELKQHSLLSLNRFFRSFFWYLLLAHLLPFSILCVWGDLVMEVFLGEGWEKGGDIIPLLAVLFFFRSMSQSFGKIYPILRKQHWPLTLNIIRFITFLIVLTFGTWYWQDFYKTVGLFVIASSMIYLLNFSMIFRILRIRMGMLLWVILLFAIAIGINYFLRSNLL